jgi:hypothetical protein
MTLRADCPPPYDVFQRACKFKVSGWHYEIDAHGKGVRSRAIGVTAKFAIELYPKYYIEGIQFAEYDGDLLLVYSVSDGEAGGGIVTRLDGVSLSPKWSVPIDGFNLSPGIVERGFLYQAAFGFVSKLDLSNGHFAWKHGRLYDRKRYSFNAFEAPEVQEDQVLFRERVDPGAKYKAPRVIRVEKQSGRLSIE